jgi:hypothetical protein
MRKLSHVFWLLFCLPEYLDEGLDESRTSMGSLGTWSGLWPWMAQMTRCLGSYLGVSYFGHNGHILRDP